MEATVTMVLVLAAAAAMGAMPALHGITGEVRDVRIDTPAAETVDPARITGERDIDLKRMAAWAMNYLIRTPRERLGWEPVFQCHPLQCPPVPEGQDPVVACDTDARMDWEWYFMREVSGSRAGRDVEAAFHRRIRQYIGPDGRVWSHPGCFNEGDTRAVYGEADRVVHIWGATKILKSLAEDYRRRPDPATRELAMRVMHALKRIAVWPAQDRCWFPCGMGALRADGTVVPNGWNSQPPPIVEPLVTLWLATKEPEALEFARACARGVMENLQPGGIRFQQDGSFNGHSHATLHAVWGIAHLGAATGDDACIEFARRAWDWMLTRGTGTGWFPAGPDNCNETCCLSDMMSIAALVGQSGRPEYYDHVERYLRNYIAPLQFVVTPEFEAMYRRRNQQAGEARIAAGLRELARFQGGIIGGSGVNDFENVLLGGASGFEMFGCCAPEGMRAIYTTWNAVIDRRAASRVGPAGVYVNLALNRRSPLGEVVSHFPQGGGLTVRTRVRGPYFLRPPHWAPREAVRAFVGGHAVPVEWSGAYVRFDARRSEAITLTYPLIAFHHGVSGLWKSCAPDQRFEFDWRGNMVVGATPAARGTALFAGSPRLLGAPPAPRSRRGAREPVPASGR